MLDEKVVKELHEACEKVKQKKWSVYEKYVESYDKFAKGKVVENRIVKDTPYNVEKIIEQNEKAHAKGDGREMYVYAKAIAVHVFLDDEFAKAVHTCIHKIKSEAIEEDERLQNRVSEEEKNLDRYARSSSKLEKARTELNKYRQEFSDKIIKPVLDADKYLLDNIPSWATGCTSARNFTVLYGPGTPVKSQVVTLLQAWNKERGKPIVEYKKEETSGIEEGTYVAIGANGGQKMSFLGLLRHLK